MISLVGVGSAQAGSLEKIRFPALQVRCLQIEPSKRLRLKPFRFSKVLKREAVVLLYFLPGHGGSETELRAINALQGLYRGKIRFVGVTRARNRFEIAKVYKRVAKLGVTMPVLLDEKGLLAYVTMTRQIPSYAVVDRSGFLRLINASSLMEKVGPRLSFLKVLKRISQRKKVPFLRAPGYSPNPYSLIDRPAPAFELASLGEEGKCRLKTLLGEKRLPLLLVFWSITCPHCRASLLLLARYLRQRANRIRMVTLVDGGDDPRKKKMIRRYLRSQKLQIRVLLDKGGKVSNHYLIKAIPAAFFLDSKGVLRGARVGGGKALLRWLERSLSRRPK